MAITVISICNSALSKIGSTSIVNLTDNNRRAKLCNEQYEKVRDDLLRSHPWNFAIKRSVLTNNNTKPEFEWEQQFELPSDFLRAIKLYESDQKFVIEGRMLLTNDTVAKLIYISKIEDPADFESNFAELLALNLAYEMTYPLVQSNSLKATIQAELNVKLRDVRSFDAQEGYSGAEIIADDWLNARI